MLAVMLIKSLSSRKLFKAERKDVYAYVYMCIYNLSVVCTVMKRDALRK